jgi:hypothetical protein
MAGLGQVMNYKDSIMLRAEFLAEVASKVPQPFEPTTSYTTEDCLARLKFERQVYYLRYSKPKPKT